MAKARKKQGSCHPALRTLILCQGEVTEKIYFDEMRKLLRWSAADIKCAAQEPYMSEWASQAARVKTSGGQHDPYGEEKSRASQ